MSVSLRERLLSGVLAAVLVCTGVLPTVAAEETDPPEYEEYLNPEGATPVVRLEVLSSPVTVGETGTVSCPITVPEAGYYRIALVYRARTQSTDGTVSLRLDDVLPFEEAADIPLEYWYENEEAIQTDSRGNDLLPTQTVSDRLVTYTLANSRNQSRPLSVWLADSHTLTFTFSDAAITLEQVLVYNDDTLTYDEYLAKYGQDTGLDGFQTLQAEAADFRNLSSLVPATDRTGPQTVPSDPISKKLNVISGNNWKKPGSAVTWTVTVPEEGYYTLGLRWRQNLVEGLFSSRQLEIDGQVPFAEAASLRFVYDTDWQYTLLGGATPYRFFLTAGKHELTLRAVPGDMLEAGNMLTDAVYALNEIYRRILMITGASPDPFRDYALFTDIDGLQDSLVAAAGALNAVADNLESLSGIKGGQTSIIRQLSSQLKGFAEDDAEIPDRLSQFKSNISAVAALLTTLQEQPLDVDYITVAGTASKQRPEGLDQGFFASLLYQLKAFFGSFFNDYSAVGDEADYSRRITVWYSGGREQAEIVKRLVDEGFSQKQKVAVELQLVQISLSQAIMANTAPDVMLGVSRGQPVNLGIRGVLQDLSRLEGFSALAEDYTPEAFLPYTCRSAVYGVPVTMNFHMLFARTDVLADLGLEIPQTWEEMYACISRLQRANMALGLPYSTTSSQGSIEAGMGAKDLFPALLLQNGGRIYNDDHTATVLDEEATVEAFREWVTLYTEYQLDTVYDFNNRFRTGEMPLGVADYSFYNTLQASAPEIRGLWTMVPIPGTLREDGTIDRSEATSGSACVILRGANDLEAAWELTKWWCSATVQAAVGNEIEILMGESARYCPANLKAMELLPWTDRQLDMLHRQITWLREIPEVVGGYYTVRGLDNAFRNVLFNGENYRESLMEQMEIINTELTRKQREFPLLAEEGK